MSERLKKVVVVLFSIVFALVLAEIFLRLLGFQPLEMQPFFIESEPKGTMIPDSSLGLKLNPGTFKVTMNHVLEYKATHLPDSTRTTGFRGPGSSPEIWVYGCSFTYGMGVNDEETFAYRLQDELGDSMRVVNKGVPGYGNVQALVELKKSTDKPLAVILGYAAFHNERNVMAPLYGMHLKYGFLESDPGGDLQGQFLGKSRFPVVRDGELTDLPIDDLYHHLPFSKSLALMRALQDIRDSNASRIDMSQATLSCIKELHKECKEKEIPFGVFSVVEDKKTRETLERFREEGIPTAAIAPDVLSDSRYNNQPHDSHPNSLAHQIFSDSLLVFLQDLGTWVGSSREK